MLKRASEVLIIVSRVVIVAAVVLYIFKYYQILYVVLPRYPNMSFSEAGAVVTEALSKILIDPFILVITWFILRVGIYIINGSQKA
jgi:hypothetical protein